MSRELKGVLAEEDGAALWREGVGAGDAFLATLIAGIRRRDPDAELLRRASRVGAWMASPRSLVRWKPRPLSPATRSRTRPGSAPRRTPGRPG